MKTDKKRTAEATRKEALKHLRRTTTLDTLAKKLGVDNARPVIDDLRRNGHSIESFGAGRFARG